jgi:diguanylate cyclase (GGDEF)-like protein
LGASQEIARLSRHIQVSRADSDKEDVAQLQFFTADVPRVGAVDHMRRAAIASSTVLRQRDRTLTQEQIAADVAHLFEADVVHAYELGDDGEPRLALAAGDLTVPPIARRLERELLPRALASEQSMLSTHPALDRDLRALSRLCSLHGVTTEALVARAFGENQGAYVVHWLGRERPSDEELLTAFWMYWESVGYAIHSTRERLKVEHELARLRQRAYFDRLTGLPNRFALDEELDGHERNTSLSMLVLDFDGMREANEVYGYEDGGDVLIAAVGSGLRELTRDGEFAARLYTAGDEFAVILPHADEQAAGLRADEIEAALDALPVPDSHRGLYHGASVGFATRLPGESVQDLRRRASAAMVERKHVRRAVA